MSDLDYDDDPPHVPLCPGCDRLVGWDIDRCPFCGEEFEANDDGIPADRRRAWLRHLAVVAVLSLGFGMAGCLWLLGRL